MFESDPLSFECICNIDESVKNEFVGLVIAESLSSCYDLSDVCLSAIVGVQVEEGVEIFNLCKLEGRVLCDDGLCEDLFLFLLDNDFTVDGTHGYIENNII